MTTIVPVILSGGSGSRLWPVSRASYPKQLLPMVTDRTMLQDTAARLSALDNVGEPIIVCNEAHRFIVAEQMREIGVTPRIVLEPEGRNTAPAVALAALIDQNQNDGRDTCLLVMPADHVIANVEAFADAVTVGLPAAGAGSLVTFGVVPRSAHTGYGYIRAEAVTDQATPLLGFEEKPDAQTAERFLASGEYLWNSGMFLFSAASYLAELWQFEPGMLAACRASLDGAKADQDYIRPDAEAFRGSPSNSIDYAVMERTSKGYVVPLDAGWSDVGSWPSIHEARDTDAAGNAIQGDVMQIDCQNSLITAGSRLVTVIGLDEIVVVETADAVLIAPRSRAEDVKQVVERLKAEGRIEASEHG